MFISIEEIDRLIKEDVPYIDLTSWSLGIGEHAASIMYFVRDESVVCGTEEVKMIFERFNIKTEQFIPSGTKVKPGDELISGTGRACDVHMAWKVGQNILEYCSGIAKKAAKMVEEVKEINPNISILTTRKVFPGTKVLTTKAIMMGGAVPHRLGISETILVFKQHIDFVGGFDAFVSKIPEMKTACREKNILVETCEYGEAKRLCEAGAGGIQFDKVSVNDLRDIANKLKEEFEGVIILAAGGVNENNAVEYAKLNIDGIVTTSLYTAKPADIGVVMKLL